MILSYFLDIDLGKCTKCGLCEKSCGLKVVEMVNDVPKERSNMCNSCGHCVAICPLDAIKLKDCDMTNFISMQDHGITYEQYYNLVRNRKSIRNYLDKPLNQDHINKIMDSVRYIPTGANRQHLKYNIVTDPNKLLQIKQSIAKKFIFLKKMAKIFRPFVPKFEYLSLMRLVEHWNKYEEAGFKGKDPFLQGAPCVIIIYSNKQHMLTQWESGIACYNIISTAETLGIGNQLLGYLALTAKAFKSLRKPSMVPKKHKILAALLLGYSDIKYLKTVDRRELDVKRY